MLAIVALAQERLKRFATAESFLQRFFNGIACGDVDGLCLHIRLARIGTLPRNAQAELFFRETQSVTEDLNAAVLNSTVIMALLLSVLVAVLFLESDLGGVPFPEVEDGSVYSDVASFFRSDDPDGARAMRRTLYTVESVFLTTSLFSCCLGLIASLMHHQLLAAMPDPASACKYMLKNRALLAIINYAWMGGMNFMLWAIPFALGRSTALLFFLGWAAIGSAFLTFLLFFGAFRSALLIMQAEAKIALRRDHQASERQKTSGQANGGQANALTQAMVEHMMDASSSQAPCTPYVDGCAPIRD